MAKNRLTQPAIIAGVGHALYPYQLSNYFIHHMGKLKITQVKSTIDRSKNQKATIVALGLRKINQTVEHNDTPQIRGMVAKVQHLLKVEQA